MDKSQEILDSALVLVGSQAISHTLPLYHIWTLLSISDRPMLEPEVHFGGVAKVPKGLLVKNEISTNSLKTEELHYGPSSSTW